MLTCGERELVLSCAAPDLARRTLFVSMDLELRSSKEEATLSNGFTGEAFQRAGFDGEAFVENRRELEGSNHAACSTRPDRVAYIHIPKVAGSTLLLSLFRAGWPVCNGGTDMFAHSGITMCSCLGRHACAHASRIAVMEVPTRSAFLAALPRWGNPKQLDAAGCILWFSIVRSPESWFYSAVGQTCKRGSVRQFNAECQQNAIFETLLQQGWFGYGPAPPKLGYYANANKQT